MHAAVFLWAFAEATFFPLPPEILLVPLIVCAPDGWFPLVVASLAGSLAGGAVGFSFARLRPERARTLLVRIPGVAPGMVTKAERWIGRQGVGAVAFSAWTGVPYKIFAVLSGAAEHAWVPFIGASVLARGLRVVALGWGAHMVGTHWGEPIRRQGLLFGLIYVGLVAAGYWFNQRVHRAG